MARRRRRRRPWIVPVFVFSAAALSLWWWSDSPPNGEINPELMLSPQPILNKDRPKLPTTLPNDSDIAETKGTEDFVQPASVRESIPVKESTVKKLTAMLTAAKEALERHDIIAARMQFSKALPLADGERASFLRAELTRLGHETIFSARIIEGDTHVERYIVKPGDSLGKIAKAYHISADLLAYVNNIRNVNLIRAGQAIKVIKGPFRADIHKKLYTLDLYLGDTFVKNYKVGLGTDNSTPTGQWRVGTKLKNPTYYPPRSGQIVSSDDPSNPLGERWIGLVGIRGEALGQERYGIHGTIEPDSIGRNASLGCVRLYNKDVEELYMCLVEQHSNVTIY